MADTKWRELCLPSQQCTYLLKSWTTCMYIFNLDIVVEFQYRRIMWVTLRSASLSQSAYWTFCWHISCHLTALCSSWLVITGINHIGRGGRTTQKFAMFQVGSLMCKFSPSLYQSATTVVIWILTVEDLGLLLAIFANYLPETQYVYACSECWHKFGNHSVAKGHILVGIRLLVYHYIALADSATSWPLFVFFTV